MARGYETGGRKKGTPNKATAARAAAIAASGLTPLDYALSVLRDDSIDRKERLQAAIAAARPAMIAQEFLDRQIFFGEVLRFRFVVLLIGNVSAPWLNVFTVANTTGFGGPNSVSVEKIGAMLRWLLVGLLSTTAGTTLYRRGARCGGISALD